MNDYNFPFLNKKQHFASGLYLVATPIGNLQDLTFRAVNVLREADIVVCEDTRVTGKLLSACDIDAKLFFYNDHSDEAKRRTIIDMLKDGKTVALVSDAGAPLISDPGYKLVRDCVAEDIHVTTIPGASAPLAALQLSALPSDRFVFLGFAPSKQQARTHFFEPWNGQAMTLICFETGPRLGASLQAIDETLGARDVAVVREITKLYEDVQRGTAADLMAYYAEHGVPKGEIVLVIGPATESAPDAQDVDALIAQALEAHRVKDAATLVAGQTGLSKKEIYARALALSKAGKT